MLLHCPICGNTSTISKNLPACADCIISNRNNIMKKIQEIHIVSRKRFNLTEHIPRTGKRECRICGNRCRIPKEKYGYCSIRKNEKDTILPITGNEKIGILDWYYDPLPTNCVASWICEGTRQKGKKNLAVFYRSCSFDCLFCQNWHFREESKRHFTHAKELASKVGEDVFCICYFGGDPSTQMEHALTTSKIVLKERKNVRICWETNGNIQRKLLEEAVKISLISGGTIKFDIKAFEENLHVALCGVSNKTTLKNFEYIASLFTQRAEPPLLVASTLMIPGYITEKEVFKIARFIANLNENIPYTLLAFYPSFYLQDLPLTSQEEATRCFFAAKEAGLKKVKIGNIHLLK